MKGRPLWLFFASFWYCLSGLVWFYIFIFWYMPYIKSIGPLHIFWIIVPASLLVVSSHLVLSAYGAITVTIVSIIKILINAYIFFKYPYIGHYPPGSFMIIETIAHLYLLSHPLKEAKTLILKEYKFKSQINQ